MTKKTRRNGPLNPGKHRSLGEEPREEGTLDHHQRSEAKGGDDTQDEREPACRPPAVCICPSCGRTEAQLPTTPCHEMLCPRCRVLMRES